MLEEDHHADDPERRVRDRERGAETDHLVQEPHGVVRQPDRDVDQHRAHEVGEEGRAEERHPEGRPPRGERRARRREEDDREEGRARTLRDVEGQSERLLPAVDRERDRDAHRLGEHESTRGRESQSEYEGDLRQGEGLRVPRDADVHHEHLRDEERDGEHPQREGRFAAERRFLASHPDPQEDAPGEERRREDPHARRMRTRTVTHAAEHLVPRRTHETRVTRDGVPGAARSRRSTPGPLLRFPWVSMVASVGGSSCGTRCRSCIRRIVVSDAGGPIRTATAPRSVGEAFGLAACAARGVEAPGEI